MPCSDGRREEWENLQRYGIEDTTSAITTKVCCEALKVLDEINLLDNLSELANKWWVEHQKFDEWRKKHEINS